MTIPSRGTPAASARSAYAVVSAIAAATRAARRAEWNRPVLWPLIAMALAAVVSAATAYVYAELASAWPVARMQTLMSAASRLVETARREPLGIPLTRLTMRSKCPMRLASQPETSTRTAFGSLSSSCQACSGVMSPA